MIFKKLGLEDIAAILPYLSNNDYGVCDFSLGALYMWSGYFDYKYCIKDGYLFICGADTDNLSLNAYAVPLSNKDFFTGVEMLIDFSKKEGKDKIVFNAVPLKAKNLLEEKYNVQANHLPDWADYVYDVEKLSFLKGHIYNKKRNLVHQFEKLYEGYVYEPLNKDNIQKILDKYFLLCRNDKTDYGIYEETYTVNILKDFSKYNFESGVILYNGDPVSFTIGSIINDMLYVHIEKADIRYKGAYQIMNMLFARDIFLRFNVKYINREEDLGDLDLRRTKQSYHPAFLIDKFRIEINI